MGEPTIRSACLPRTVSVWLAFLKPFLPLFTGIRHLAHVLSVPPTKAWLLCATLAGLYLYIQAMPVDTDRVQSPGFPKIVYWAGLYICQIWLPASDTVLFLWRRPGSQCARLARIWSGRPGQVLAKHIRSRNKLTCKVTRPGSGRTQSARYQFPTFTQLHSSTDGPDHIVKNQPGSDLVLANCVRFWPNDSSLGQCARIIRPTSGQRFQVDPDQTQIGFGMFTGYWAVLNMVNQTILNWTEPKLHCTVVY